jgi:hypothetical protein
MSALTTFFCLLFAHRLQCQQVQVLVRGLVQRQQAPLLTTPAATRGVSTGQPPRHAWKPLYQPLSWPATQLQSATVHIEVRFVAARVGAL